MDGGGVVYEVVKMFLDMVDRVAVGRLTVGRQSGDQPERSTFIGTCKKT